MGYRRKNEDEYVSDDHHRYRSFYRCLWDDCHRLWVIVFHCCVTCSSLVSACGSLVLQLSLGVRQLILVNWYYILAVAQSHTDAHRQWRLSIRCVQDGQTALDVATNDNIKAALVSMCTFLCMHSLSPACNGGSAVVAVWFRWRGQHLCQHHRWSAVVCMTLWLHPYFFFLSLFNLLFFIFISVMHVLSLSFLFFLPFFFFFISFLFVLCFW